MVRTHSPVQFPPRVFNHSLSKYDFQEEDKIGLRETVSEAIQAVSKPFPAFQTKPQKLKADLEGALFGGLVWAAHRFPAVLLRLPDACERLLFDPTLQKPGLRVGSVLGLRVGSLLGSENTLSRDTCASWFKTGFGKATIRVDWSDGWCWAVVLGVLTERKRLPFDPGQAGVKKMSLRIGLQVGLGEMVKKLAGQDGGMGS